MSSGEPPVPGTVHGQTPEQALVGDPPTVTSADVAAAAGMPLEEARQLWRALGFPDSGNAVAFTVADLRALVPVTKAVEAGALPERPVRGFGAIAPVAVHRR